MNDDTSGSDRSAADSVDTRQLAFVLLAVFALVTAAFLAPTVAIPTDEEESSGGGDDGQRSNEQTEPGGGTGFGWLRWLTWLLDSEGGDPPGEPRCIVTLSPPPEPGETVTATVVYEDDPLVDAPVWFDGHRVGRTDENGRVTGDVPYVRELSIRVGVEGAPDCHAATEAFDGGGGAAGVLPPASVGGVGSLPLVGPVGVAAAQSGNASVSYHVDGEMMLSVRGSSYPGEELNVQAILNGRPVPDAEVTIDGETRTRTDSEGTATVRMPDDGSEEVVLRASRGEFADETTVEILLLDVGMESPTLAVVPGTEAAVVASFSDRPATDAVVTVDGKRRGTIDENGRLDVTLPVDPGATIEVQAREQTATTSVAEHYAPTATLVALVVALATAVAYWRRGRRTARAVLVGACGLLVALVTVVVVDAYVGPQARNALLVGGSGLAVFAALLTRREAVAEGAKSTAGLLARIRRWVYRVCATLREQSISALLAAIRERFLGINLRLAEMLGALVDAARQTGRDLLAQLRSLPWSPTVLFALTIRRLRHLLTAGFEALQDSPLAGGSVLGAVLAVAVGYGLGGRVGFVVAAIALAVVAVGLLLRRNLVADEQTSDETATRRSPRVAVKRVRDRSLRGLWRAFARVVAPDSWRSKTPTEVSRAAIEQGYPEKPVAELTALFTEVEYGNRSVSETIRERAVAAYERLRDRGGDRQ